MNFLTSYLLGTIAELIQFAQVRVIDIMPDQKKLLEQNNYGATMRLGAYPAILKKGTMAFDAYNIPEISERHRSLDNKMTPKKNDSESGEVGKKSDHRDHA